MTPSSTEPVTSSEPASAGSGVVKSARCGPGLSSESVASDDGRRMAVQALFEAQGRYVWRVLLRLGVHASDVEDLCQEVFSTAFRRFDDLEGRAAMTSWLYGICLRQAAKYRRTAHRRYEETSEVALEQEALGDPEQSAQAGEVQRDIDRALDRLSVAKRQVFVLYEFGELDMPEVARAVGASEKTCYSRLYAQHDATCAHACPV